MKDQEFSRPREEFASTGREFSPPTREFTPPAQEYHKAGMEFDQSPAPVEKKKKGVSPLMLTTAAVVTSAIVLTSGGGTDRDDPPKLRLSPEEAAVITEISEALEAQDHEALTALAENPPDVLYSFLTETMPAYEESLASFETEYQDLLDFSEVNYYENGINLHANFTFDGAYIGPDYWYIETDPEIGIYLDYYIPPTGEPILQYVTFFRENPNDVHDLDTLYSDYSFNCNLSIDPSLDLSAVNAPYERITYWSMTDSLCKTVRNEQENYWHHGLPDRTVRQQYNAYGLWGEDQEYRRIEGNCIIIGLYGEDGFVYESYVENGSITIYDNASGSWSQTDQQTIRDGYTYSSDGTLISDSYHEYYA